MCGKPCSSLPLQTLNKSLFCVRTGMPLEIRLERRGESWAGRGTHLHPSSAPRGTGWGAGRGAAGGGRGARRANRVGGGTELAVQPALPSVRARLSVPAVPVPPWPWAPSRRGRCLCSCCRCCRCCCCAPARCAPRARYARPADRGAAPWGTGARGRCG